jgi:hypothetical protein
MTFDEWVDETASKPPYPFSETDKGCNTQNLAAKANPCWQHLTEHGRVAWICTFFNPRAETKA